MILVGALGLRPMKAAISAGEAKHIFNAMIDVVKKFTV